MMSEAVRPDVPDVPRMCAAHRDCHRVLARVGIATRNGIMLVSHIRHLQEREGVTDFQTAVRRGSTERLVPILMTALAAGLALVPIALSAGEPASEIQAPMATVIVFGLASSTAFNMIVVPIVYARFGRPVAVPAQVK